jgi:phospholipid/cholesterol/gamma-HCH transport system permease protein
MARGISKMRPFASPNRLGRGEACSGEALEMDIVDGPKFTSVRSGDTLTLELAGRWTIAASAALETGAGSVFAEAAQARRVVLDLGSVAALDTAGAWLIDKTRRDLTAAGVEARLERVRPEYGILLEEAHYRRFDERKATRRSYAFELVADIGESVVNFGKDVLNGVSFLGEVVASLVGNIISPLRFRAISLVFHVEQIGFRSVPIIALINFLVGCIVAQQGIFQLQRFGASTFAVDLIGILVLRELGVLLTSIMIAGRSGSAVTAEIGSMKMREEIDALKVMGLRPVEVLIVPRILALVVSLPMLTFIADMSALFGGLLVAWGYGGINPTAFMTRLQSAIAINTFLVGLIKAPFMALVIGVIASIEGLAVEGSAESLGRRVTASVVKSIFMVIVLDGFFAVFFAGIRY